MGLKSTCDAVQYLAMLAGCFPNQMETPLRTLDTMASQDGVSDAPYADWGSDWPFSREIRWLLTVDRLTNSVPD